MSDETVTLEQLRAHGIEPVPEIVWDDIEVLRPGVDFRHGVTYITVPSKVNVEKTIGRGKGAKTVVELEEAIVAVSSERDQFPFTRERVAEYGFGFPAHVTLETTRRWSTKSVTDFIAGNDVQPDPTLLHAAIRKVYEQYVEFAAEEYYDILPLFVMGSYMFRLFNSIGYIHFNGTAQSGKSQNLSILSALSLNAVWASSMSPAALYRQLAGMPGTVMIDEAEGFDGERGEELRRILNAGYLDGSTVRRAEKGKNDQFQVVSFESFGPKAIASINPLDNVIGSRCLIVAMRPALRKIGEFQKDSPRWQGIRDQLYLWAMYHTPAVADLVTEWNETLRYTRAPSLIARQWQITQLYIVLADYLDRINGGDLADRLIEFFNQYFARQQAAQDATDRIRIVLRCLPRVLQNRVPDDDNYYPLKAIHEEVVARLDSDAVEYYKTRSVSKNLDVLGFRERRSRKGGTQVRILAEQVRQEFVQRRVEPYEEDVAWLNGEVEYTPTPPVASGPSDELLSMWAEQEQP